MFPCLSAPRARDDGCWVAAAGLAWFHLDCTLLSSDDVDRFLKLASRGGCLVGNT